MPTTGTGSASPAIIPVVLDATVGGPNANSYADVDQAIECLRPLPQFQEWFTIVQQEKEFTLIRATFYMETRYRWYGKVFSSTQKLSMPRTTLFDHDGRIIQGGTMPPDIICATALLAAEFAVHDLFQSQSREPGQITRVESGNVEIELGKVSQEVDVMLGKRFPYIENLLEPYGRIWDNEERASKIQRPVGF